MKLIISILTLLFLQFSFSQTGIVQYSVNHTEEMPENEFNNKISEEFELMTLVLTYNEHLSYFTLEPYIAKDELHSKFAKTLAGVKGDWEQSSGYSHRYGAANDTLYRINYEERLLDWRLENETTTIDGYQCYKASQQFYNKLSRNYITYIAWYTPEIPVSYGPLGFGGLPGLILQLEYKKKIIKAEKIILNPKSVSLERLPKVSVITGDEYNQKMRAARMVTPD